MIKFLGDWRAIVRFTKHKKFFLNRGYKEFKSIGLTLCLFLLSSEAFGYDTKTPTSYDVEREKKKIQDVGLDLEKKGELVNTGLVFASESGEDLSLGKNFSKGRPVLLSMVYYRCSSLCNLHMNGVVEALEKMDLKADKDYRWVTVSMDSQETPDLAIQKKESYIHQSQRKDEARKGWSFLTGTLANIKELTDQLGFKFKWDDESQQFAHSAALYVLSPEGKISQIIPGVQFEPRTLKLSIIEAAKGRVGSFVDRALMMCFQFNPKKNKYTIYAYNIMKIGGVLILILLGIFLIPFWIKAARSSGRKSV